MIGAKVWTTDDGVPHEVGWLVIEDGQVNAILSPTATPEDTTLMEALLESTAYDPEAEEFLHADEDPELWLVRMTAERRARTWLDPVQEVEVRR